MTSPARAATLLALVVVLPALLVARPAAARDNTQHLVGLGFQANNTSLIAPQNLLSVKFAAAPTAEFAALVGLSVDDDFFAVAFGGKALLVLIPDEHVNVYIAAAAYPTVGSQGLHRFSWFAGPGLAYYLPGAPHVEIFAEFGLGGTVPLTRAQTTPTVGLPEAPYVATTGSMALGLHYWF